MMKTKMGYNQTYFINNMIFSQESYNKKLKGRENNHTHLSWLAMSML